MSHRVSRTRFGAAWVVGGCLAISAALLPAEAQAQAAAEAKRASGSSRTSGMESRVPPGCALGIAGPALSKATSVREARDAAFAALAAERLPLRLTSEVSWQGAHVREIAGQEGAGWLHGAVFAGIRSGPEGRVDALVCGPEVSLHALGSRWQAAWPAALTRRPGCALGLSGEDIDPPTRARNARRDALEMLARAHEVEVQQVLLLEGGRRVRRAHAVRSTGAARDAVDTIEAALAEQRWLDRRGRGPLRVPGVLYLQLCSTDT